MGECSHPVYIVKGILSSTKEEIKNKKRLKIGQETAMGMNFQEVHVRLWFNVSFLDYSLTIEGWNHFSKNVVKCKGFNYRQVW